MILINSLYRFMRTSLYSISFFFFLNNPPPPDISPLPPPAPLPLLSPNRRSYADFKDRVAAYSWDGSTLTKTADEVTAGGLDDIEPVHRAVGLGFTKAPHAKKTAA